MLFRSSASTASSCSGNAATATWADTVDVNSGNTSADWYPIVWHSGDTLYSSSGVRIYANGNYAQATYFNMTHGSTARTSDTVFYSSTDDYIRKTDAASFRTSLNVPTRTGGNASGTWGISITGNAATSSSCSGNAATASSVAWANITGKPSSFGIAATDVTALYQSGTSIKVYTYASGGRVTGDLLVTGDIYAYYSDERLKDVTGAIVRPLESIKAIDTFYYRGNAKAAEMGAESLSQQVGVSAQSVARVLPEAVGRAPLDDDGEGGSISGEDYMSVKYERLVPLLIEGIKDLTAELESVKIELQELKRGV